MFNLTKSLIPMVKEIKDTGLSFEIGKVGAGAFSISAESNEPLVTEGVKWFVAEANKMACAAPIEDGYKITVRVNSEDPAFTGIKSDEAYYLDTQDGGAVLTGKSEKGAFYACITLSKMLHVEGDSLMLARAYIRDWPDFEKRGYYIETRYGTEFLTLQNWKDMIDYFAEMKTNYVSIGVYTCWVQILSSRL